MDRPTEHLASGQTSQSSVAHDDPFETSAKFGSFFVSDKELEAEAAFQKLLDEEETRYPVLIDEEIDEEDSDQVLFEDTTIHVLEKVISSCWTEYIQKGNTQIAFIRQALEHDQTVQSLSTWSRLDHLLHCKSYELLYGSEEDREVDKSTDLKSLAVVGTCTAAVIAAHSSIQAISMIARTRSIYIDDDPAILHVLGTLILEIEAKDGCGDFHWSWINEDNSLSVAIAQIKAVDYAGADDRIPSGTPVTPPATPCYGTVVAAANHGDSMNASALPASLSLT